MRKNWGIDWGHFIDIGEPRPYGEEPQDDKDPTPESKRRLQFAYKLDTSLVNPLSNMPLSVALDAPHSLAQRNLLRGYELGT